jgi:hypothetical protein
MHLIISYMVKEFKRLIIHLKGVASKRTICFVHLVDCLYSIDLDFWPMCKSHVEEIIMQENMSSCL